MPVYTTRALGKGCACLLLWHTFPVSWDDGGSLVSSLAQMDIKVYLQPLLSIAIQTSSIDDVSNF